MYLLHYVSSYHDIIPDFSLAITRLSELSYCHQQCSTTLSSPPLQLQLQLQLLHNEIYRLNVSLQMKLVIIYLFTPSSNTSSSSFLSSSLLHSSLFLSPLSHNPFSSNLFYYELTLPVFSSLLLFSTLLFSPPFPFLFSLAPFWMTVVLPFFSLFLHSFSFVYDYTVLSCPVLFSTIMYSPICQFTVL